MKDAITEWWNIRSQRERLLIQIMGAVVGSFLVLSTLVFPVIQYHHEFAASLPVLRASVDQLHRDADEAIHLRQELGGAGSASIQNLGPALASHIEQSAAESGIRGQIQSITTLENGQVEIVLPKVNFNRFLMWADHLKRTANVRIQTLNATGLDNAGGVQLRAVLQQIAPAS
jgi:general secretion pathway protein M